MNKELRKFCITEFVNFENELANSWSIERSKLSKMAEHLKRAHKSYLAFATLCHTITLENERSSYIKSAPEACLLSLAMITKGLENSSHVMMRQCIELTLKNIYFFNHPVEYKWSQNRINYREINFQFLLDYLRKSDEMDLYEKKEDLILRIEEHFHILSRYVHVHNIQFASFSTTDFSTKDNISSLKKCADAICEILALLISINVAFFLPQFLSSQSNEQALVKAGAVPPFDSHLKDLLKKNSIS